MTKTLLQRRYLSKESMKKVDPPLPPARIVGYFCETAPVCVIARTGPRNWTQLILWNTETDEFTPGQWIRGRVISLSFSRDGKYIATNVESAKCAPNSTHTGYSIISKPPYFTALEIWIGMSHNSPGDVYPLRAYVEFGSDDVIYHREGKHKINAKNQSPFQYAVKNRQSYRDRYSQEEMDNILENLKSKFKKIRSKEYEPEVLSARIESKLKSGRIIVFDKGCIYEVTDGIEVLLLDTNSNKFEEVIAPDWATEW